MPAQIEAAVRQFVTDNFLYRKDEQPLSETASFLDAGLIDSTGILELVGFLEKAFSIRVADAEIVPENLDSIRQITTYVQRKLQDINSEAA